MEQMLQIFYIFISSVSYCKTTSFIIVHVITTVLELYMEIKKLHYLMVSHGGITQL